MSVVAFQKEFGPLWPSLPRLAAIDLTARHQQRLRVFNDLFELALERGGEVVEQACEALFPGHVYVCTSTRPERPWMAQNVRAGLPAGTTPQQAGLLPRTSFYRPHGGDPFANRPVNLSTLVLLWPTRSLNVFEHTYATIFEPNGVHHQLRALLYDERDRAELFVGFFRRRGEQPFALDDHGLLQLALPRLHAWYRLSSVLGTGPHTLASIGPLLEASPATAWLLSGDRLVYANHAARLLQGEPPWVRQPVPGSPGHRLPLRVNGRRATLVLAVPPRGSYKNHLHSASSAQAHQEEADLPAVAPQRRRASGEFPRFLAQPPPLRARQA